MRKGLIVIGIIALLVVGALTATTITKKQEAAVPALSGEGGQSQVTERVFPVNVITATRGTIHQKTDLNVTFTPASSVPIVPKVAGTIDSVAVKVGDAAPKGKLLFTIDAKQYRLQVQQAEAAYEAAQANLAQLEKGASAEDLKQAEAGVAQAEASLAGAKKGLENAQKMLNDRTQYKQQLQGAETQVELAKSQLQAAKTGLDQAKTAYANAESEYQRMQELYAKEMISRQQLDGVRLQYESAKAGYEGAQERLNQAQIGLKAAEDGLALAEETYADPLAIRQQVDAAQMQYEMAQAGLAAAQARLVAVKKGASTEQLAAVRAQVKQAKTALEMAQLQLEYTRVTAPIAGQVAQLNVEEGGLAAPGNPVGVIAETSTLKAKAFVPETYINKLDVGQKVDLTATALPNHVFSGQISSVSPMADQQTRQFPVEIVVANAGGQLKAGMFGTVSLVIGEEQNTVIIPVTTVLYDRGQPFVYTVVDGRAQTCEIELGLSDGEVVAVRSGLTEGMPIISVGQHQVKSGTLVEVR